MSWIISVCASFKVFANFSGDVQTEKSRVTHRATFNHFQSKHENSVHSSSVLHLIFSPGLSDFPMSYLIFFCSCLIAHSSLVNQSPSEFPYVLQLFISHESWTAPSPPSTSHRSWSPISVCVYLRRQRGFFFCIVSHWLSACHFRVGAIV